MRRMYIAALAVFLCAGVARAEVDRCDLHEVIGYQVIFAKQVVAYVQAGKKTKGYEGCEPDRVLVFGDGSGVRCKDLSVHHLDDPPTAFLFGKSMSDLKLCVDGEMFGVTPTN